MDKYNSEGFQMENGQFYKINGELVPIAEYEAKNKGPEVAKTDEKKEGEPVKTGKKKLHPLKVAIPVIGGIAVITAIASTASIKIKKHIQYNSMLNNDDIRTSSMFELVDRDNTSLDELLNRNTDEYLEYENFRNLLNAKRQMIDPKIGSIQGYKGPDIDYNDITYDRIDNLDRMYYHYYKIMEEYDANTSEYKSAYNSFNSVCGELNSISKSIDEYEKTTGSALVKRIADKVLASKVIDERNLNPDNVTNISGIYKENGKLKVSFDYDTGNNSVTYTGSFNNDGSNLVENIAKDISAGENLNVIHETKVLAQDSDYDGLKIEKTK